ncbi:MAG: Gfo/Idh/MocA family oxidoreductase [bacterium]
MSRKLRMAMVGGGKESFIAQYHRMAAQMTGRIDLVCGAFGSTRHRSFEGGEGLYLARERIYGAYRDMLRKEATLPAETRPDFIVITAPNNLHYPVAMAALDAGFHVLCEKPLTTSVDEVQNLERKLNDKQLLIGLTFSYTGYPMVREAQKLIREGRLGNIRRVMVECPQGWLATRLETAGNRQASWRADPRRAGPSGCMADVGAHGSYLTELLTGLPITEVSADVRSCVAGRQLEDDGAVLFRLGNGAQGVLWASQICVGETGGVRIRIFGDKGGMLWELDNPNTLTIHAPNGSSEVLRTGFPVLPLTAIPPAGRTDGLCHALAYVYNQFADGVLAFDDKRDPTPVYPSLTEGVRAVQFVDAVIRNTRPENTEKWTKLAAG